MIQFIGVCTNPQHLCIITELCTKGDLFDVIRKYKKPTFAQQVTYMYDIALGVSYLHQRRPSIIHRDLKSMNILVRRNIIYSKEKSALIYKDINVLDFRR